MSDNETQPIGLLAKLVKISEEIGFIEFDGHNPVYGKKGASGANYASAAGVIRQLNRTCAKYGVVALSQEEVTHVFGEGTLAYVRCTIRWCDSESGQVVESSGVGSGADRGDKAVMKASTAAYKYAVAHAFSLGWGAEDPEEPKNDREANEAMAARRPSARAERSESRSSSRSERSSRSSRSERRSSRSEESAADPVDALLEEIASASADEMSDIRRKVVALRRDSRYDELKDAFAAREASQDKESNDE